MDLKFKDVEQLIEGMELPSAFKLSLSKRGKTVVNHRYAEYEKELQILCSTCHRWYSIYTLRDGQWVDINKSYKVCNLGKVKEYFDSYCNSCYSSKGSTLNKTEAFREPVQNKISVGKDGFLNDRVQRTVFLTKENDLYLQLFSVMHGKKKNVVLNEIIDDFRNTNRINI